MLSNIILDQLPKKTPNGFEINTSYKQSIKFEILMQDKSISKNEKITIALNLFFEKINENNIDKQIDDIIWFYKCGKEEKTSQKEEKSKNKQIYSYEFDAEYIYSAFLDQYGVDLQDIEYLHWWKFKAMFNGLKKDNKIVEIMGYRSIDVNSIKDKKEKERYKKLQELYALPDMRSEEEKEDDFANALW